MSVGLLLFSCKHGVSVFGLECTRRTQILVFSGKNVKQKQKKREMMFSDW